MQLTLQNLRFTLRDFYGKFHRKRFIQYRLSSPWWHSWVDWGARTKTPWHLGAPERTSSPTHQADVLQDSVCKLHHQDLPYSSALSFSALCVTAHGGNKSVGPAAVYALGSLITLTSGLTSFPSLFSGPSLLPRSSRVIICLQPLLLTLFPSRFGVRIQERTTCNK